jgi:hypothetical protein
LRDDGLTSPEFNAVFGVSQETVGIDLGGKEVQLTEPAGAPADEPPGKKLPLTAPDESDDDDDRRSRRLRRAGFSPRGEGDARRGAGQTGGAHAEEIRFGQRVAWPKQQPVGGARM